MTSAARRLVTSIAALAACGGVLAAAPEAGRHAAELCVATLPKPPSCGPAQVDVRTDGTMRVRVDDVVYKLQLRSSQVEVVVMHNVVQIDEFTAPFEWAGDALSFNDDGRRSRYELRFAARHR